MTDTGLGVPFDFKTFGLCRTTSGKKMVHDITPAQDYRLKQLKDGTWSRQMPNYSIRLQV